MKTDKVTSVRPDIHELEPVFTDKGGCFTLVLGALLILAL